MGLSRRQFTKEFKLAAIERLETHLNAVGVMVTGSSLVAKATIIDHWRNVFREGLFPLPPSRHRDRAARPGEQR